MSRASSYRFAVALAASAMFAACGGGDKDEKPTPTTGLRIDTFAASANSVAPGERVTLNWKVSGASPVTVAITATPGGSVTSSMMAEGSVQSAALDAPSTVFKLVATGGGKTVERELTVTTSSDPDQLRIVSFGARPTSAPLGGQVQLSWQTTGATQVRVLEGGEELFSSAEMVATGTFPVTLTEATHTYTLEARSATAQLTATVDVVASELPDISFFRVTPLVFTGASADVSVTWTTQGTTTLTANGTPVASFPGTNTGTISVTVTETTEFELTVSGAGQSFSTRATVARGAEEAEPNDEPMEATSLGSGGGVLGEIATEEDVDFYSVTVPAGGNVTAQLSDAGGGCELFALLELVDSAGESLGQQFGGCAAILPEADGFAADLAAGTYYVVVQALSPGAYELVVTTGQGGCGNQVLEESRMEECDDGNTGAGDGCDAQCRLELAGSVTGAGGAVNLTLGPEGSLATLVEVTISQAGQSITATTSDGRGACPFPTAMALYTRDASRRLGLKVGEGGCAFIAQPADAFAADLEVGDYLLVVGTESGPGGAVQLRVDIGNPRCGNGILETRAREQCDDGNGNASDGCSPTCTVEALGTVSGLGQEQTFSGAISPAGNADYYQVVLPSAGYIEAETGVPTVGMCDGMPRDTVLTLFDSAFQRLGENDDFGSTTCSRIDPRTATFARVPAGTYYVEAKAFSRSAEIAAYQVRIRTLAPACGNGILDANEQCDDGNTMAGDRCSPTCQTAMVPVTAESEPNNDRGTADASGATLGASVTLQGALTAGDVDYFSFVVPAGRTASVRAQTYFNLADPADPCTTGDDTILSLEDGAGMVLAENDDAEGLCSLIDPAEEVGATNLAPGTYSLKVRHFQTMGTMATYFLDVTLSP